jgi:hypothetical protein
MRYRPRFAPGPLSTMSTTRSCPPAGVSLTAMPAPWFSQENQSGTGRNVCAMSLLPGYARAEPAYGCFAKRVS